MLNPETVVMRRVAGVRPRRLAGVPIAGAQMADDPVLFTGGGFSELKLDLLFDVGLAGSTVTATDVRTLTAPFWQLSENTSSGGAGFNRPQLVTFFWAKSVRVTGLVASVAERLEQFNSNGEPRRSWLRMRMIRAEKMSQSDSAASGADSAPPELPDNLDTALPMVDPSSDENLPAHQMIGSPVEGGERLDVVAQQEYGSPSAWQWLAAFNHVIDPLRIPTGTLLKTPALSVLMGKHRSASSGGTA